MAQKITLVESSGSGWHIRRRPYGWPVIINSETYCGRTFVPTDVSLVDSLDRWGAVCAACGDEDTEPEQG